MRDLLQKPWFVGLLSLAALGFVYLNIVDPLLDDQNGYTPSASSSKASGKPSFASTTPANIDATAIVAADWDTLAKLGASRNPFTPMQERKIHKGKKRILWPSITAIVIGPTDKFAVVNGNVVQEGQKSGKFTIVKITADKVRLRYGKRYKTLTIHAGGGR